MIDLNSPEFDAAVKNRVREVLRNELNDYIQNASILPIKIRGQRNDGNQAQAGDFLQYNATEKLMEVGP